MSLTQVCKSDAEKGEKIDLAIFSEGIVAFSAAQKLS
jgi:hypothetical protein